MLKDLKKYYNPQETNLVYLTIHQPGMTNALNSGSFSLQSEDTESILHFVLNMFNRFVNSNQEVKLNQGFRCYFQVLSYSHLQWANNQRKSNSKRTLGCKTDDFKINGCVEIPLSFEGHLNVFENKCLLTSVILGYYCNEYYRTKHLVDEAKERNIATSVTVDTTHFKLWNLYRANKRVTNKKRKEAGMLLLEKVKELQFSLNLSEEGPYIAEKVLPKLADYYKVQIHLLKNNQEKEAFLSSYPEEDWNPEKSQIFLYPKNDNHVVPILKLTNFKRKNRQFCPLCRITFSAYYRHFCKYTNKCCFRCKSYHGSEATVILPNHYFKFCFSSLKRPEDILDPPLTCSLCNFKFPSKQCYLNHKTTCGGDKATKSKNGHFCDECKKFHPIGSICQAKSNSRKCKHCGVDYIINEEHNCQLKKETLTKKWPKLIFFDFEFENTSTFNCVTCYNLKLNYLEKKQMSLKEGSQTSEFYDVKCDHHCKFAQNQMPNYVTIWKEVTFGHFHKYSFSSDDLGIPPCQIEDHFESNYDWRRLNPNSTVAEKKGRSRTETTTYQMKLNFYQKKKSVLDYFGHFMLKNSWKNYTFLSLNHKTDNMSCILEIFARLNMTPEIIRKGHRYISIVSDSESLTFLNASNYFKGSYEEIAKQFSLNMEPVFFPTKLNCEEYYNYSGMIPNIQDFYDLLDSKEEKNQKEAFVASFKKIKWNFKDEIQKVGEYKTQVVARSCLKFLKSSLDFQCTFKKNMKWEGCTR